MRHNAALRRALDLQAERHRAKKPAKKTTAGKRSVEGKKAAESADQSDNPPSKEN